MADGPRRDELRPFVRRESSPGRLVIAVRGGPDTIEKVRNHASRTHRAFVLDGEPFWGISVSCALESTGPASLESLLRQRFFSYALVHLPEVGALLDADFELLPTFNNPHYTLRLATCDDAELSRLLAALGQPRNNPYHGGGRSKRR